MTNKDKQVKDYQTYYDLGLALAKEKKWHKAIAAYRQAITYNAKVAEVYHHWGDALINLEKWQKAVKIYQKAIDIAPNFAWSHHNFGVALFNSGKQLEAIAAYEKAISLNRDNANFYYSLAKAQVSFGDLESAVASYDSTIELGLKEAKIYHELGDILSELKQWNNAIAAYQESIKLDGSFAWSYHNLGLALLELQLAEEAVNFFRKAIELNFNFVSARYYLGRAFSLQEKWDEAIIAYRQAEKIKLDFPGLQLALAESLESRSQVDLTDALTSYHRLLDTVDNPGDIYYKIGLILAEKQQLEQALFYVNQALIAVPDNLDRAAFYTLLCQQRSRLYEPLASKVIADNSYSLWSQYRSPTRGSLSESCLQLAEMTTRPNLGIILPLKESDSSWLVETIATIQNQVYPHWQLYLATATINSNTEAYWQNQGKLHSLAESHSESDYRIQHLPCDKQMSLADLGNEALAKVTDTWVIVLARETLLTPHALLEIAQQLVKDGDTDIIYGDEDKLKRRDLLTEPWFKPKWCPDLLLSRNYFGSLVLCRTALVKELAGLSNGFGEAYNYDLFLRLTEKTTKIEHLPIILCHNRQQTYQEAETTKAVTDALNRRGEKAVVTSNLEFPEIKTIRYEISQQKLVSIIIPTRNLGVMLNRCLQSLFELTTYPNYEVIVVDNGSDEPETLEIIQQWQAREANRFKCLKLDIPFNYSRLNNQAVTEAAGEYLLFLNNDMEIITPDWLEGMLEQAQRDSIGAVGALLLYPDDTIQHAGVVLGVTGVAGHGHRNYPVHSNGYKQALIATTNYSAVTGACLLCRRKVFQEIGGFNEDLAVAYNDVDFCLQLKQKGYHNVWLPHVRLYHYESQSRTTEDTPEKQQRIFKEVAYMEKTWGEWINNDPCYSINLTKEKEDYSLNLQHQTEVKAIFLAEVSSEELYGFFLDEPKPGCLKENSLDIIGWVVGKVAPAISLEVIWLQNIIATTEVNHNRPDVAMVYPDLSEAENSGFLTTVDLTELPQKAELTLQVILANSTKVRLSKIQLG